MYVCASCVVRVHADETMRSPESVRLTCARGCRAGEGPRLVFIVDGWHPELKTDAQRRAALDTAGKQRYARAVASLRARRGLPDSPDLVADRRERVIF